MYTKKRDPKTKRATLRLEQSFMTHITKNTMVHILCYNIYAPPMITSKEHVSKICNHIKYILSQKPEVTVIALTEVFRTWVRDQILHELASIKGKWKATPVVHKGTINVSSGLLAMWNTDHVVRDGNMRSVEYKRCFQLDCFSNKGAVHVPLKIKQSSVPFNLILTHMQAWQPGCSGVRDSQFKQLGSLLKNTPNENVVVVGDFNENPNLRFCSEHNLKMPTDTFLETYQTHFFDHVYSNRNVQIEKLTYLENPSDHSPVLVKLNVGKE